HSIRNAPRVHEGKLDRDVRVNPVVVDGGLLDLQWLATRENLHVVRAVGVRHFAGKDVLVRLAQGLISGDAEDLLAPPVDEEEAAAGVLQVDERGRDRKSTRLNSSH